MKTIYFGLVGVPENNVELVIL